MTWTLNDGLGSQHPGTVLIPLCRRILREASVFTDVVALHIRLVQHLVVSGQILNWLGDRSQGVGGWVGGGVETTPDSVLSLDGELLLSE